MPKATMQIFVLVFKEGVVCYWWGEKHLFRNRDDFRYNFMDVSLNEEIGYTKFNLH